MNVNVLFGKTRDHLVPLEGTRLLLHRDMVGDFLRLREDARAEGHDLAIASAFRDYDRQLKIWNAKASGERPLLDERERPLRFEALSPEEIVFAILRWSAIPGSSRHHWGTDIDVFDGSTQAPEAVKLVPSEVTGEGPAIALHDWLDRKIAAGAAYGFYRPYEMDRGGVAPERWHLSYYPLSRRCLESYTFTLFRRNLAASDLLLKDVLLEAAEEIYRRFLINVDLP